VIKTTQERIVDGNPILQDKQVAGVGSADKGGGQLTHTARSRGIHADKGSKKVKGENNFSVVELSPIHNFDRCWHRHGGLFHQGSRDGDAIANGRGS
jgi:hypothetical protein